MEKIVLASGSPRRRELLTQAGVDFEVRPVNADETLSPGIQPEQAVLELAKRKAHASLAENPGRVILAADTLVAVGDEILGKPQNKEHAAEMLRSLSGREHRVFTGVAVTDGKKEKVFAVCTRVEFYELSDDEIADYIATGEPMDKAGGYGIQGRGCVLVREMHGDYFNVVGLPVSRVCRELREFFRIIAQVDYMTCISGHILLPADRK